MHGVQSAKPQAFLTTDYTDEYRIESSRAQRSAISGRGTLRRDLGKVAGSSRSRGSKTRELEAPTTLTSAFRPLPRPISGSYPCNLWLKRIGWIDSGKLHSVHSVQSVVKTPLFRRARRSVPLPFGLLSYPACICAICG